MSSVSIFGNFSQPGHHVEKKKNYFLQNGCGGSLTQNFRNGKSNLPPIESRQYFNVVQEPQPHLFIHLHF